MSPKHLVAAISLALVGAPLSAQSVKAGIEAWQKSDYTAAVAIWRPLADRGFGLPPQRRFYIRIENQRSIRSMTPTRLWC